MLQGDYSKSAEMGRKISDRPTRWGLNDGRRAGVTVRRHASTTDGQKRGRIVMAPTRAAVTAAFQPVMDALRAKSFATSELMHLRLKRLSATTAIASGVAVRRKADGQSWTARAACGHRLMVEVRSRDRAFSLLFHPRRCLWRSAKMTT
jgi:hypothetical protein